MKTFYCVLISGLVLAAGCGSGNGDTVSAIELNYHNPVWDGYHADPQVLYHDGVYYAYGTGQADEAGRQFPVLRSENFTDWTYIGGALESATDPPLRQYWAPFRTS